jgi:hypothetical protein
MLYTYLTTSCHLRYPIIGAPMDYAVSQVGGLGMIGSVVQNLSDSSCEKLPNARGKNQGRFKAGLPA